MQNNKILWVDDEIELLKPHIIFLEKKGFEVEACADGVDAISAFDSNHFDIVFLDESMPGISGLELLSKIKEKNSFVPIVMITKNEEEAIMEEAIGSQIADYLIKPVNPNQILLTIKKNLDNNRLVSQYTLSGYRQEFRNIAMDLMNIRDYHDWTEYYKKLVYWEIELNKTGNNELSEMLIDQKREANDLFSKFIVKNYKNWLQGKVEDTPTMSHTHFSKYVLPLLKEPNHKVCWLIIDNFRLDQWKVLEPMISQLYRIEEEEIFFSILPTATQYARNAMFAGLMPSEIEKRFPEKWKNDTDEGGKNLSEEYYLRDHFKRYGIDDAIEYRKILNSSFGKYVLDKFHEFGHKPFISLVYNFVDTLSHAKTDTQVIKELVKNEKAYRDLTLTWFANSTLWEMLKKLAVNGFKIVLTTDHGMINVQRPVKIQGDKETSTNIRYKMGRNLKYNYKELFTIDKPEEYYLPKVNLTSSYVFAQNDDYLIYPNNYHEFVKFYENTYQHGGVSMEEIMVPAITLFPK